MVTNCDTNVSSYFYGKSTVCKPKMKVFFEGTCKMTTKQFAANEGQEIYNRSFGNMHHLLKKFRYETKRLINNI